MCFLFTIVPLRGLKFEDVKTTRGQALYDRAKDQSKLGEKNRDAGKIRAAHARNQVNESRSQSKTQKYLLVSVGLIIIVAIVLLPLTDRLLDLYGGTRVPGTGKIPAEIRVLGSGDLVALLTSRNMSAAAYAVQELGYRHEVSALPQLLKLLNNNDPLNIPGAERSTSLAKLSEDALRSITRHQIELHPGNISILRPLLETAGGGTLPERMGAIAVLGTIREPFAVPLLSKIADDGDEQLRETATQALAKLKIPQKDDLVSTVLHRTETRYLAGLCIIIAVALGTTTTWLYRRTPAKSVLLLCIPVILVVWITLLAGIDFSASIAVDKTIDDAVQEKNLMSLKAMLYDEFFPYPGDSYVAQYLVKKGTDEVVYCLTQLPSTGPDDDLNYKNFLAKRIEWILSRIISISIYNRTLDELLESTSPSVRTALATTLGKLGAKNEAILGALQHLSSDPEESVQKIASEALTLVKKYPPWRMKEKNEPPRHEDTKGTDAMRNG